jgi:hypothetical protein
MFAPMLRSQALWLPPTRASPTLRMPSDTA